MERPPVRWRDLSVSARVAILIVSLFGVMGALVVTIVIIFLIALIVTHGTINIT